VVASCPVTSASRFAARPVGEARCVAKLLRLQDADHGFEDRRLPRPWPARDDEELLLKRLAHRLALLLVKARPVFLLHPGQRLAHVNRRNGPGGPEEISHPARELRLGHVERREVDRIPRGQRFHGHALVGGERGQRVRKEGAGISSASSAARSSSASGTYTAPRR